MSEIDLHIVSFNIPYPANYGGIIDVFYKLKKLSEEGVRIHLHCFQYGRSEQLLLEKYATKVSYYNRNRSVLFHFSKVPYIVYSRRSNRLIENLLKDNAPILFEGLHTCYLLNDSRLSKRFKIVRTHNVEHDYYNELSKRSSHFIKKKYYQFDALKLKRYEPILQNADLILPISFADFNYFESKYGKTVLLPPFHGSDSCKSLTGKGEYALYHGNLSVAENYIMAEWIIENIFSKTNIPLIIAGNNPTSSLIELSSKFANVKLVSSPDDVEMTEIISNAHLNLLFTHQSTGLKLKLLNALFNGRFCLCNPQMIAGTGIKNSITVVDIDKVHDLLSVIESFFNIGFTEDDFKIRSEEINIWYNNDTNSKLLMKALALKC